MIGCAYGMNLGYPINPARDLGPRLLAYFIYGSEVFTYHNYYFWIPIIAPLIGGVFGAWLYHIFVGAHLPDDDDEILSDTSEEEQSDNENRRKAGGHKKDEPSSPRDSGASSSRSSKRRVAT
ncbi:unnamed protein product [Strongylus vulgaris]|uniref:Aquaporin n=1 Tax=Strongylus vulgaris TaxID=40348 RepID=A0A3P7L5M4_STRVU|nr:unnamed protein product [Strongylus vulgaris]